ncbi:branched-chain amino acid transport system II carrier protein [Elizabethkingia sp. JS20170427COW]|uniref:branched-chain amino acid transport system II carrier protein n=1 Tax=Elizabethkingia sp. JS20170427COW TaxID=2583851 RepID=UPI0011107227|nr:branched-chain amino acid transport system II carrier protein [Elizabethkingia sp. JS20170427COW]QCX52621.1 branched-chain amino acid transport system II carrier protein [Elizabethkingia sp. JS20170427COW]
MKSNKIGTIATLGFALFAMFFGAGNLILPPFIGLNTASDWFWAIIGFTLTGIIAPFLGILAVLKVGENISDLGNRINPTIVSVLGLITMWLIGPLIAIPRIGATTFEMGFSPIFQGMPTWVGCSIFFLVTGVLSISPNKIVDIIGKYLTPLLIVLLLVLVLLGIFIPVAPAEVSTLSPAKSLMLGFMEGYQTMDVLASIVFAGIIIMAVKDKGFNQQSDKIKITISAGLLSMFCLMVIYGGLIYLGATSGYQASGEVSRTQLLLYISNHILGKYGVYAIAIAISLACLTTSIALTTAFSEFMENITKGKLKYQWNVVFCCVVSLFLSLGGVDKIIEYAGSLLGFVYPMILVIVLGIVFLGNTVRSKFPYVLAIVVTGCVSVLPVFSSYGIATEAIGKLRASLPLSQQNLEWIIPAILAFIIGVFTAKKAKS